MALVEAFCCPETINHARPIDGLTPLHAAALAASFASAATNEVALAPYTWLLQRGADARAVNAQGVTAEELLSATHRRALASGPVHHSGGEGERLWKAAFSMVVLDDEPTTGAFSGPDARSAVRESPSAPASWGVTATNVARALHFGSDRTPTKKAFRSVDAAVTTALQDLPQGVGFGHNRAVMPGTVGFN